MASAIFSSAQRIISQVLQWLQTSGQDKTTNLITDTFSSGINNSTSGIGEGFIIVPGSNNTNVNPSVNITTGGIAIDPLGNRIFISPTDTTLYNASNPLTTTNDGLGNFLSTPQSTGVVNIPVTQSSSNYLWVNYLATIDTTQFTLNSETNAKIFFAQTDGYLITVTVTNIAPNSNSIFLGSVTTTGVAVAPSNISQIGRTYYRVNPSVVPITTPFNNGSNRTPTYAQNSTYTLDAHIKSIGTGTGISPTNPHNMSLQDLGVSVFDTVQEHRILEHGNAIIAGIPGTPYPTLSGMAQSINIVNPGSDTLNVFALSATEFAIINGMAFNTNAIFGAVPANATVIFPSTSGTYNVYWDSTSQVFGVTLIDISTDNTKLWFATVTYMFVGTGPLDHNALSSLIDRRRVGSTTHLLQRWTNNSRPGDGSLQPQSGEFGFNLSSNLLEYWDGTMWQQPVNSSSNSTVPSGAMLDFAGASAPTGYLLCNGTSYSTSTYPTLFAAIGYIWGGAGPNFNVPDFRRRVAVGSGGAGTGELGNTVGNTGGEESHTQLLSELVSHNHILTQNGITVTDGSDVVDDSPQFLATGHTGGALPIAITSTGGGSPFNVIQPSAIVTKIIKI